MENKLYSLELDFKSGIELDEKAKSLAIQIKQLEAKKKELEETAVEERNKIRYEKVKELHDKLKSYRIEIKKILEQREYIVGQYCKKNGHNYVRIKTTTIGKTKYHCSRQGDMYDANVTYKCTVCGDLTVHKGVIDRPRFLEGDDYKCVIPEQCLNSKHSRSGKTFIELTNELTELIIKEKYVQLVLEEMCTMFGHDAIVVDSKYDAYDERRTYKCKCCERKMGITEYEQNYLSVPYPGLVDYKGRYKRYIVSIPTIIDLSNINIHNLEESIVVPGTKCQEEEKEKQLQKTKSPKYFDFSKEQHFKLPKRWY